MGIMLNGGNKDRLREEVLHPIGIGKEMISIGFNIHSYINTGASLIQAYTPKQNKHIGVCLGVGVLV